MAVCVRWSSVAAFVKLSVLAVASKDINEVIEGSLVFMMYFS
jgi:hypothetical protein